MIPKGTVPRTKPVSMGLHCVVCFLGTILAARFSHAAEATVTPERSLARVFAVNKTPGLASYCHVLLFYKLGDTDLPGVPTGADALKPLLDENVALKLFGASPFIRTRAGLRYLVTSDSTLNPLSIGESHRDQCLATFAALELPTTTKIMLKDKTVDINALILEAIATFSFDQAEPSWTAIAFSYYLPPKVEWQNRFGETLSLHSMASRLMSIDRSSQSCGGIHLLQALVALLKADDKMPFLSTGERARARRYVSDAASVAAKSQAKDGSWDSRWYTGAKRAGRKTLNEEMLITGHLMECFQSLPVALRPPRDSMTRGIEWLSSALQAPEIAPSALWLCPYTHAASSVLKSRQSE